GKSFPALYDTIRDDPGALPKVDREGSSGSNDCVGVRFGVGIHADDVFVCVSHGAHEVSSSGKWFVIRAWENRREADL
ncbi:hypothetical protein, partial [Cryobacterium sp. 10I5]|uniref:hypothetical protein n=1 Tax=Cryobacterium sp. 10I5 TaxID=3048581 RepID=UPI002B22C9EA